ncbi:type I polyketide synthase [Amycolatopsis rifamycinica]|uniref:type I polyketide synthase n=1 Tax=Amycolatopsis rifamycinica TaxID=287986 RepID=UPI00068A9FA6|nr:type I polyketide synthase [Amycolatopsis rifamycinica]
MTDTSSEISPTDIAVVGMAGRFPGADDVRALWETVRAGRSGITRFTDEELLAAGVPAERLGDPAYVKAGAVVRGVEDFDAGFFGINPKEAQILDPQHRLFLEHSQHALEDAACDPARFDGAIGVFAGCAWSTYLTHNLTPANAAGEMGEIAIALGNDKDTLATRVSHTLGLSGPAFSVQSACSTSLVAVCVAATSLANFECDVALAGGVSIGVPHQVGYLYQQGGIAPPDGECRAFDAAGLGAPLGGGVGVVALRRLEDALADGDRVYAVLRGWAVNNDAGRKVGFTAPGVEGQATVIAEALAAAGLEPSDIGYVEAHGTGTALGDAAEIAALQQVFAGRSLRIGSVKTNVGHLDRAAGVTNLIKAALALHHEEIPPTRNLGTPNPQLTAGGAELTVVTERTPWPRTDTPRRAGVSAFGIGGTNAHVVLEEAPLPVAAEAAAGPELLVWSARSAAAADAATANLAAHLETSGDALADVAHTLQSGRTTFGHRRMLVASSPAEAARNLREGAVSASSNAGAGRRVGFLIAGTGEQYPGLAAELYASSPVFRAELDRCRALLGESVLDGVLGERQGTGGLAALLGRTGGERAGDRTEVLHPALFAVEYALAQLVRSWGVEPSVLVGYSLGEYVAACLAGVLSLEDALALVTHRAKLIAALPGGAMAAVPLAADDVRARIAGLDLDIAALNGPQLTVVSGTAEAIEALRASLDEVPCRPLATTHAFHSRQLAGLRDELTAWVAANVTLHAPTIPYVSNVTGELVTDAPAPAYWAEHMCAPVRFDDALATVLADEDTVLLELGPGRSLGAMARGHRACPPKRWASVVPTLPGADDPVPATTALAEAAGRLWLAGVDLGWTGVRGGRDARRVGLPGYPFQRERYWIDAPGTVTPEVPRLAAEPDEHVQVLTPSWRPQPAPAAGTTGRVAILPDSGGVAAALAELLGDVAGVAEADTVVDLSVLDLDDEVAAVHAVSRTLTAAAGDGSRAVRVLLATRTGQAAGNGRGAEAAGSPAFGRLRPAQAAVAVLPVVANQEYLNLEAGTVDLDAAHSPAEAAAVLAAELRSPGTPLVAYRGDRRLVPGHRPAEAAGAPAIRPGGSYLITGGLGEVGLTVAEHLVTRGARRLVLAGRSGGTGPAVARLRALGAEVHTPRVDVGDLTAMRALLAEHRFDGIVHAAADSTGFRPLSELDEAAIARHFAAKVGGARVLAAALDELRAADRPEWTLLFSSTSALLGGVTFGSYAAANAALLAEAHGRPGWIAAAWDTWPGTLERLDGRLGATMARHAMTRTQALAAFDRLTALPGPAVIVAAGGLDERLPGAAKVTTTTTADRFPRPDLPQPYTPPMTATERGLAEVWSSVLGVEPVGTRDNFFDLNGNSLLALQMLALVKERFGVAIPTVTLFELPTVQALAATLDHQAPVVAPAAPVVVADPDDDELDRHIAIVGMAGRFPGAGTVDEFWRNLCDGVESITFFSPDELVAAGVDPAQVRDPAYVPARPVLDDVTGFDAAFFGLSPRMAALTDPQQRLFLEVCWEALEQSGYARPGDERGRVGVFGGCNLSTYLLGIAGQFTSDADASIYELVMGNDKDALTTTVSYLFDLRGPSMAVQTFCSTSLVAVHTAMRSLRAGDCEMALAGGVSVRVPDRIGHLHSPGGQESPDGHVRTFDAQAHGSMFGDGATVVVLKKLGAALRDGDHIWSVIRGSAMNNDGALKVGYTAPSVGGQSRVIADAMADARVAAEDVGYVEAHGTATELGDPIEVAALTRAFGDTAEKQYCALGSVKPNVGHLDRAAGTAGLIKASLVVREGLIPPTLHYTAPNPEIDFAHSPFRVAAELAPWNTGGGRPRIAGLNSLGMGGTNVHVVVEQPPDRPAPPPGDPDTERRYQVLPVSARTAEAADTAARRLGEHLAGTPDARLADVAFTLQEGRKTFEHRRAVVASDVDGAATALAGAPAARVEPVQDRPVAFLFAGVGEQYPGLVAELYRREPVFRAHLDECLGHLDGDLVTGERGGGPSLAALLGRTGEEDPRAERLQRTELAQPLMFAVDYALARTLVDWGLRPAAMLGYSLGEYVAACLAGVLSLDDALALVAKRAELIAALPGGAMAAVPLPVTELEARFDLAGIDIAAVNGPELVVVAGEHAAVERLAEDLRRVDVPCRPLRTSHAFHSRMLAPAAAELTAWITANVTLNAPELPYLSNVTGEPATAELVTDPGYWARHMCETVRFADAATALLADEHLAVVEIGPGPSLGALLRGLSPASRWPMITATLPAADDPRPADEVLTDGLARLWLLGASLDWPAYHGRGTATPVYRGIAPGRVPLPTYPFQRQRYWIEAAPAAGGRRIETPADGPLEEFDRIPLLPEEQWLNLPTWRQTSAAPAAPRPASWLVFARPGLAEDVLGGIRRTGDPVTVVRPGAGYRPGPDATVRPGDIGDLLALLRDLKRSGTRLDRVVHLWNLDDGDALSLGLHTLVALARAAGELGLGGWTLDLAATGTQRVLHDGELRPDAATLTGPNLVIPMEYPGVQTRLIDVDAAAGAVGVVAELHRPAPGRTVALRGSRRWLPGYEVLAPQPIEQAREVLREHGVYLITGGLGGIGLAMAERLARDSHAKLVLFGRRGLPPRERWAGIAAGTDEVPGTIRDRVDRVLAIEALGGEVAVVEGDVAEEADVRRAVAVAVERFGALHGILHTAGVPGTGLMQFKEPGDADQVLAPKLPGSRALSAATEGLDLDFVALFSSITSVTGGGPGQVDYCAGNAWLDAYAAGHGGRTVSISWGEWTWNAWDDGLSGYEEDIQTYFREHRAKFGIDFEQGWRTLLRALASGEPHVVVSTQDLPAVTAVAARFSVDAVTSAAHGKTADRHPRPELVTPFQEPEGDAERAVAEAWCDALRLDRVGASDNFFELGGTSLLGISLLATLRTAYPDAELPPHIIHEAPTVAALAKIAAGGPETPEPAPDSSAQGQLRRSGIKAAAARRRRA